MKETGGEREWDKEFIKDKENATFQLSAIILSANSNRLENSRPVDDCVVAPY